MNGLPRKHGVVFFVNEIASPTRDLSGESARVLGKMISRDPHTNRCTIEHNNARLLVDVALLGMDVTLRHKSLYEFLGELEPMDDASAHGQQTLILKARIVRVMDGVDLTLYDQAVKIRRKFEAEVIGRHQDGMIID
ncbi:hypothetical protein SeMB42_g00509 [Synchytrium endobioticum]|uniref:Uncharacterized protein n=1 Tax=Synchytrium endobioticum TaxID=286115 RepID=A0A507DRV5_9FUNG|nr:hypothetical protein SeMB42_g00509 [Synchytrium endobioticum]